MKNRFIAFGYSGIEKFERQLWARGVTWDDFWVHEEQPESAE